MCKFERKGDAASPTCVNTYLCVCVCLRENQQNYSYFSFKVLNTIFIEFVRINYIDN